MQSASQNFIYLNKDKIKENKLLDLSSLLKEIFRNGKEQKKNDFIERK